MSMINKPLSQTVAPRRAKRITVIILGLGILLAVILATLGYLERSKVETVVVAATDLPIGHQLSDEDLMTIEMQKTRPASQQGVQDTAMVVGQYTVRPVGEGDVIKPAQLSYTAPDQPVYPRSGETLQKDMVQLRFPLGTVGPLSWNDTLNVGFLDTAGDTTLCINAGGTVLTPPTTEPPVSPGTESTAKPWGFACRLLSKINVLDVDDAAQVAYLEVTPYQAQAIWSLAASNLTLWGERYGSTSDPLGHGKVTPPEINPVWMTLPASQTLTLLNPIPVAGK